MIDVDLHMHSVRSDGHDEPVAVAHACRQRSCWSLTDHDTISGWRTITDAGLGGMGLVCGVEVTAALDGHEIHIVGLGIRPDAEPLAGLLKRNRELRRERLARLIARLPTSVSRGLSIADFAGSPSEALGRSHLARALVRRGGAASIQVAFQSWLGDEHCRDPELNPFPPPDVTCTAIAACAGVAILAHPAVYGTLANALRVAEACGTELHGIELDSPRCDGALREGLLSAIAQRGWLVSRGSDRHSLRSAPLPPSSAPVHPGLRALIERLGAAA